MNGTHNSGDPLTRTWEHALEVVSVVRTDAYTKKVCFAAACIFLIMASPARGYGLTDNFTNTFNPESTSGHMVLSNGAFGGRAKTLSVTAYSWTTGQFLAEVGPLLHRESAAPMIEPTVSSFGTWLGTSWEYASRGATNGQLVIYGALSKEQQEFLNALGGCWPARYEFDRIRGRGMDYRDFLTLRIHSGEIEATHQALPVPGTLTETETGEVIFGYAIPDLQVSYIHRLRLEPFKAGGYLVSKLATWTARGGKTNLTSDYTLLSAGISPLHASLSPFELYPAAKLIELSKGNCTPVQGTRGS